MEEIIREYKQLSQEEQQHWYFQRGKYMDIMFAENGNTDFFWDNMWFPQMVDEFKGLRGWLRDYIDNGFFYGDFYDDESVTIGFKNGSVLRIDGATSPDQALRRKVTPILAADTNKKPLFVIYDNVYDTMFWVNGDEGLIALQQYTGWFDIDIYTDWV